MAKPIKRKASKPKTIVNQDQRLNSMGIHIDMKALNKKLGRK